LGENSRGLEQLCQDRNAVLVPGTTDSLLPLIERSFS